uniref:Uncharacterized protein n=1 Tax=Psilocybe cubensis TaxID=181762 RepID=A0A8H7XZU1_PSICU
MITTLYTYIFSSVSIDVKSIIVGRSYASWRRLENLHEALAWMLLRGDRNKTAMFIWTPKQEGNRWVSPPREIDPEPLMPTYTSSRQGRQFNLDPDLHGGRIAVAPSTTPTALRFEYGRNIDNTRTITTYTSNNIIPNTGTVTSSPPPSTPSRGLRANHRLPTTPSSPSSPTQRQRLGTTTSSPLMNFASLNISQTPDDSTSTGTSATPTMIWSHIRNLSGIVGTYFDPPNSDDSEEQFYPSFNADADWYFKCHGYSASSLRLIMTILDSQKRNRSNVAIKLSKYGMPRLEAEYIASLICTTTTTTSTR